MESLGKLLLIVGLGLVAIGTVVWLAGRLGFRGLPGDIHIKSENVSFFFPLATCIVLSLLATAVLWIIQYFRR